LRIRRWFVVLCENFDYVPSDSLAEIWVRGLRDLDPEMLARAFEKILKTWKPEFGRKFPVVADVHSCISAARSVMSAQEAEETWQRALEACMRQYHPDLGWSGPRLSAPIARAIAAANGVRYICTSSEDDLVWAKKRFVEYFLRAEEIEDLQEFLPSPEVRPLFEAFCDKKALPRSTSEDPVATREALAKLREIAGRSSTSSVKTRSGRVEPRDSMIEQGKLAIDKQMRSVPPAPAEKKTCAAEARHAPGEPR
jgi:hypothetical protein